MTLSLSTMWMQNRADRVVTWYGMVRPLGFSQIELSHIVTPPMLEGMHPGAVQVSSIHFPAPTVPHPSSPRPADDLLSSPDEGLRAWAVDQGRRSIDLAARLGAAAVCIHAGRVDIPGRLEWVLQQRYLGGAWGQPVYQEALTAVLEARAAAAASHLDAVRRSLQELALYVGSTGVRLGIETRLHVGEIPSLAEAQLLLQEHDPHVLGLWLDTGHVQVQSHLGLPSLRDWLDAAAPRLVGVHLHDTRRLRDHLLPGMGAVDFDLVAARLPGDAVRVCEFDWYFTPPEILTALQYLANHGLS